MTRSTRTKLTVVNRQHRDPVPLAWMTRVARRAVTALRIRAKGTLSVVFVDAAQMRRLNRQFTGHHGLTDVLSFRFDGEPIVGEVIVAPAAARGYAKEHGLPYREELARYVVHGLLHWTGEDDRTLAQQRRMRRLEDRLLAMKA